MKCRESADHLSCASADVPKIKGTNLLAYRAPHFHVTDPMDYMDVLCLQENALFVMTDSGIANNSQ